jgi:predicted amidohydrolase
LDKGFLMRVATTRYPLEIPRSRDQAYEKLREYCLKAKGVNILVFPEYAGLEWAWSPGKNFYENVEFFQGSGLKDYQEALSELATAYQMIIIGGSLPVYDGHYYNRCYIAHPSGKLLFQDKIHLTPTEKALGWLKGSNVLKVFHTDFGNFSVCICYDSEFPELTSQAVFGGADVLFVPSYTDSNHGAHRVQVAARARAMENQCFTVTATCVGQVACDEFNSVATGDAGIFSPIDIGFPEDGIIEDTQDFMVFATLDIKQMTIIRSTGQVRNFCDRLSFQSIDLQKENL